MEMLIAGLAGLCCGVIFRDKIVGSYSYLKGKAKSIKDKILSWF